MSALVRQPISVRPSLVQGLGVFADRDIAEGAIIEECPIILLPVGTMGDYVFNIKNNENSKALPLGFGALYNHSTTPNAKHELNMEKARMFVYADKPIRRDDEIYIYYGDDWFSCRELPVKQESLSFKIKYFLTRRRPVRRMFLVALAVVLLVTMLRA